MRGKVEKRLRVLAQKATVGELFTDYEGIMAKKAVHSNKIGTDGNPVILLN